MDDDTVNTQRLCVAAPAHGILKGEAIWTVGVYVKPEQRAVVAGHDHVAVRRTLAGGTLSDPDELKPSLRAVRTSAKVATNMSLVRLPVLGQLLSSRMQRGHLTAAFVIALTAHVLR